MPPRSMNAPYSVRFLTMPSTIWPSFKRSSVDSLRAARSFSSSTRRDNTMLPRFLLNLMTLNLKLWLRNASRLRTGRRSTCEPGQERLHAAADRDRQATLHARGDDAFDQLVAFARGADLVPHLEAVCLLLRENAPCPCRSRGTRAARRRRRPASRRWSHPPCGTPRAGPGLHSCSRHRRSRSPYRPRSPCRGGFHPP